MFYTSIHLIISISSQYNLQCRIWLKAPFISFLAQCRQYKNSLGQLSAGELSIAICGTMRLLGHCSAVPQSSQPSRRYTSQMNEATIIAATSNTQTGCVDNSCQSSGNYCVTTLLDEGNTASTSTLLMGQPQHSGRAPDCRSIA